MAHALETRASSPANELRDALDLVERLLVDPKADTVETLLTSLDKISTLFRDLATTEIDLRSEEGRWEGILRRVHSKPGQIAAAISSAGGYKKLRDAHQPAEGEWWHLDQLISARRRRTLINTARGAVIFAVILAIIYFALPEPSAEAVFVLEAESALEQALLNGELEEAQRSAIASAEELPTSPELWLWVVALSEQLGDDATAERAFRNAEGLLPDNMIGLWVDLGTKRMQVGNLDGAEAAANEVLVLNDQEAQGYFLLGNVAEMRGEKRNAIDYFETTFALAEEGDPQLAVIAKVRMGTLLQSLDPFETAPPQTPGPQSTPAASTDG